MKILFVTKALAAGPGGGAERVLTTISSALAERGHKVELLTFDAPGDEDFYRVTSAVARVRIGIGVTTERSGLGVTFARLREIRKAARNFRPDVAVGFMHSAFIPLRIALLGTGIPVVGSERTAYRHYRSRPFQKALLHLSAPLLARMTVNGEGVRSAFPEWIRKRMTVVPNPVAKASTKADPLDGEGEKILLTVGGLRPEKDHATLIRAFARISGDFPGWKLRIVGGGALRPMLEKLATELQIPSRVEFAGTTEAVDREYANAHLLVLPSLYEGFPNCLAEGLSHGLPAIGFADCAGTNELIQDGVNGLLVAPGNRVGNLAAALADLMSSPEKRLKYGAAAPETVSRFALDRVTDQWEQILGSLVSPSFGT